jgi:hypothetical protein
MHAQTVFIFMDVKRVAKIFGCNQKILSEDFLIKSPLVAALNKWRHNSTLHTHQMYTKIAMQHTAAAAQYSFPAELDKTSVTQSTVPGNWFSTLPDLHIQNIINIT